MNDGKEKVEDGCLVIENPVAGENPWSMQYFVDDQVPTITGEDYIIRVTMKATGEGSLNCNVGNWDGSSSCTIDFSTEWQTIDAKVVAVPASSSFVIFQSGLFAGTIYISKVQVIQVVETGGEEKVPVTVVKFDYEDGAAPAGWGNGSEREVVDGSYNGSKCAVVTNPSEAANVWDCQMAIDFGEALTIGETYYMHFWAKSTVEAKVGAAYQNPDTYGGCGNYPDFDLTTEWKEYTLRAIITGENCKRLCFNLGKVAGKIYFDDIEIYYMTSAADGIDGPKTETAAKQGPAYTIGGQRVAKPANGLYIIGGKKVVVK